MNNPEIRACGVFARVIIDDLNGIKTAIKIYSNTWNETQVLEEVRLHENLDHENIVKFLEYITRRDRVIQEQVIRLEFCNGGDLRERLNAQRVRREFIEIPTRNRYLQHIISGLAYIHSKGLVHCDIHPRNILFHNDVVKIGGFRLIKRTEDRPRWEGSLRYTCPEVVVVIAKPYQQANQTAASDIWSFGCICYEMCTNEKLIREYEELDQVNDILGFKAPDFDCTGDANLDVLLKRMLSQNPTNRPIAQHILDHFH